MNHSPQFYAEIEKVFSEYKRCNKWLKDNGGLYMAIDTTPLITHRFARKDIEKAYDIFENKLDGVIKIVITND